MTFIKLKNNTDRFPFPSFNEFFNDYLNTDLVAKNVFKSVPAVNISETTEGFSVELAAPGMNKEDFKIEVENGTLKISSEKKQESNVENKKFTRKEFSYSSFSRTFNLPEQVNTEAISASYENGVLKLQLPKRDEAKQKPVHQITVS